MLIHLRPYWLKHAMKFKNVHRSGHHHILCDLCWFTTSIYFHCVRADLVFWIVGTATTASALAVWQSAHIDVLVAMRLLLPFNGKEQVKNIYLAKAWSSLLYDHAMWQSICWGLLAIVRQACSCRIRIWFPSEFDFRQTKGL